MNKSSKIYIAGHRGMVGAALLNYFKKRKYTNIITESSTNLDLRNQYAVDTFFSLNKPDYVFIAAAKVGGIQANINQPVDFLIDNLRIQNNLIETSFKYNVKKVIFLGSSCIYPKNSPQPILEEYLMDGKLEPTNEGYAIAKIAGLKLIEYYNNQYGTNYLSIMPSNMYGYNDNFSDTNSHVLAATIKKVHNAKKNQSDIIVWGDGSARREFLFVDDFPSAVELLIDNYHENQHINVGYGSDISIYELTELVKDVVGYDGKIVFDYNKPNGMKQKLLDSSKINSLGWKPETELRQGIKLTYEWFLRHEVNQ